MMTDRRAVLRMAGLGAAGLTGGLSPLLAADARSADLVVFDANIRTVDPRIPRAEASAVRSGRFVAVGRTREIDPLIGKGTEVVRAKGMTVVPSRPPPQAVQSLLTTPPAQSLAG